MRQKNRTPLYLEALEDRWVPATVKFVSGSLLISNPLITSGAAKITLTQTASNTWQVVDGSSSLGTYSSVGNIYLTGSNAKDSISVDLGGKGKVYTGNLLVNAGNGNDTTLVGVTAASGDAGNVTVLTGFGNDSTNVMNVGSDTFSGNIQVVNLLGNDSVQVGNATGGVIGGNVTVTGAQAVVMGAGTDTIGGNVTINSASIATGDSITLGAAIVGGSVGITTGAGADSVTLGAATIGGNTSLSLGDGNNTFNNSGALTVSGNFSLQVGSGNDTVAAINAGTVFQGNTQLSLGEGDNSVNFAGTAFVVQGNLTVQAGNGTNALLNNAASINGSLLYQVGNGTDNASIVGAVGGQTVWTSGNGNDSLNIGGATTNSYNIAVQFGNNDDSITLSTGGGLITGRIDGGNRFTATGNVFTQNAATLTPFFSLSNFP